MSREIMANLKFQIRDGGNNKNILTMTNKTDGDASDMKHFLSSVHNYMTDSCWCRAKCILSYQICDFTTEYSFYSDDEGDMEYSVFYDFLLGCTYHKDIAMNIMEGVISGQF